MWEGSITLTSIRHYVGVVQAYPTFNIKCPYLEWPPATHALLPQIPSKELLTSDKTIPEWV